MLDRLTGCFQPKAPLHNKCIKVFQFSSLLVLLIAGYLLLDEYAGGFEAVYTVHLWLEVLLALYLYYLVYSLLRPSRWRIYLAAIPLVMLYLTNDIFFLAFGKVFRLVNIDELPELLEVLPLSYSIPLFLLISLPIVILVFNIDWRQCRRTVYMFTPLLGVILLLYSKPGAVAHVIENAGDLLRYSDAMSVERNGRLTMMIYHEAQRQKALINLEPYRNREQYQQQVNNQLNELKPYINKRNVHLIVLESFLDPRLFSKLGFSSSPVYPEFEKLFGDKLGFSIAPVFGGGTAQSEFEALCGVPAMEKLSGNEFNVFTGSAALCLPAKLASLGYDSSASNAYMPNFFNEATGYQGTGFTHSYFPKEYSGVNDSYLSVGNPGVEKYLFDQDLFDQNLDYVKQHLQDHPGQPFFNYMLTIYGHMPHLLDPEKRPERIELRSDYPDDHLTRSTNQFYYRTRAIADYVERLIKLDPDSLIILVSDHVPPLRNGPNTYNALAYMDDIDNAYYYNRIAVINRGQPEHWPVIHHYEIPALIFNYLTEGNYCRMKGCSFTGSGETVSKEDQLDAYLRLMAHATE